MIDAFLNKKDIKKDINSLNPMEIEMESVIEENSSKENINKNLI